jgi:hypothetical protein
MQAIGRQVAFNPAEVSNWFHAGNDALRVVALNLMLARSECRDFAAVLEAIDSPHSAFEQFYGLWLAEAMLPELKPFERELLVLAIRRAERRRRFRRDSNRAYISGRLLDQLDAPRSSH